MSDANNNQAKIFSDIRNSKIDELKYRFNLWRMLLGVISLSSTINQKIEELIAQRENYKAKRKHKRDFKYKSDSSKKNFLKIYNDHRAVA